MRESTGNNRSGPLPRHVWIQTDPLPNPASVESGQRSPREVLTEFRGCKPSSPRRFVTGCTLTIPEESLRRKHPWWVRGRGMKAGFPRKLLRHRVLQHLAAGFFALAAFVGALLHHGVVFVLVALSRALLAGIGAGGTDQARERALPSHDARRGGATGRAVLTRLQRRQMLFFPVCEHLCTMGRALVASQGASTAGFRTVFGSAHVVIIGRVSEGQCRGGKHNGGGKAKPFHDHSPMHKGCTGCGHAGVQANFTPSIRKVA